MKKGVLLILGLLLSSILISGVGYAQSSGSAGAGNIINSIGDLVTSIYDTAVQPLARFLIGRDSAEDATKFFTLILFFVILVSLLWEITEKVPMIGNNGWVQFIVSFGIALITVRFLGAQGNSGWFETILMPNQVLGITLLCGIPFVIYFFFVMDIGAKSKTLAKILWMLAAVVFAMLYFSRYDEISAKAVSSKGFNPASIFLITAGLSLLFLFFDGTIRRWWHQIQAETATAEGRKVMARQLLREIHQLDKDWTDGIIVDYSGKPDKARYDRERKDLEERYKKLHHP